MRVEILQPIAGLFETDYSDVIPGDIVDIDEAHAERYAAQKPPLCQPADPKPRSPHAPCPISAGVTLPASRTALASIHR